MGNEPWMAAHSSVLLLILAANSWAFLSESLVLYITAAVLNTVIFIAIAFIMD
jgi:hypothetical protein